MAPKTSNPRGSAARKKKPASLVISTNGLIMTSTQANAHVRNYNSLTKGQRRRVKVRAYGRAALTGSAAGADASALKSAARFAAKNRARKKAGAHGRGRGRRQRRDSHGKFA